MAEERLRAQSISCRTEFVDAREIHADPDMLRRALVNLVGNAIDAMPNGGTLTVSTGSRTDGKYAVVVEDTGVGIPEGERGRIFEPYFTTKASGLGLGLVLTKKIVDAHGGRSSWTPPPEKGRGSRSRFRCPPPRMGCRDEGDRPRRRRRAKPAGDPRRDPQERRVRSVAGLRRGGGAADPRAGAGRPRDHRPRHAGDDGGGADRRGARPQSGMPILLSSAYGTIQTAVDAIKKGAYYYFEKPVDRARLLIIVERAIENLHLRESHRVLSEKLFPGVIPILGEHAAIREIKRILPRVARSESTILLTGESGTGKEVIARNVHSMSGRSTAPFLAVNCASLPDTLFESELFGTSAGRSPVRCVGRSVSSRRREAGRSSSTRSPRSDGDPGEAAARLAGKGDPPDRRQGEHPRRRPDRRGHEPGSRRCRAGREIPCGPLLPVEHREAHPPAPAGRISDIPLLSEALLAKHGEKGVPPVREITKEAMRLLMRYTWPGNIRELSSVVERAVVLAEGGVIGPGELPLELRRARMPSRRRRSTFLPRGWSSRRSKSTCCGRRWRVPGEYTPGGPNCSG